MQKGKIQGTTKMTQLELPNLPITSAEWVTPAIAREWLKKSIGNRAINHNRVFTLREDMLNGRWTFSNDDLAFDCNDRLINGHHRLTAVASIEDPDFMIRFTVKRNMPSSSMIIMDSGKPRSDADNAKIAHPEIQSPSKARTLARYTLTYEECTADGTCANFVTSLIKKHGAILDTFYTKKNIDKCNMLASVFDKCNAYVLLIAFYVSDENVSKVKEFYEKLESGADIEKKSPILYLRNFLQKKYGKLASHTYGSVISLYISAWNDFYMGKPGKPIIGKSLTSSRKLGKILGR